jgi:DNA-binding NtrC family response regulator
MTNASARQRPPLDLYIDCVVLSSFLAEFTFLQNVLRTAGIRMHHAESLDEADFLLTVTGSTVLLSDVIFEGGYWHGALTLLADRHPMVTMLVIAEPIDRPFLVDLFPRGACGIVWKPFQFQSIARQIRAVHEASKERRALQEEFLSAQRRREAAASVTRIAEIQSHRPGAK